MAKKTKTPPNDGGLSPKEVAKLRAAIRMVWSRSSYARKLCLKRCINEQGFPVCELCHEIVPKVFADHIIPCGKFDSKYIKRMFVGSKGLQALCDKCHKAKTKAERNA